LLSSAKNTINGRHPDGITLKPADWDVTVVCTCAAPEVKASAHKAGAARELAATCKMVKYSDLSDQCTSYPVAANTQDPLNTTQRMN